MNILFTLNTDRASDAETHVYIIIVKQEDITKNWLGCLLNYSKLKGKHSSAHDYESTILIGIDKRDQINLLFYSIVF